MVGGGNNLISQNSNTSGSQITLGSTACELKVNTKTNIDISSKNITNCNNINLTTINNKKALTGSYSNGVLTLTEI